MELQASGKTVGKPTGSSTDLVERAFDAFTDRDLGALLDAAAPDIELNAPGTAALARQGTAYRGHEGICAYFRDVARIWEELEVVPHEYRDLGDRVFVTGRLRARGQGGLIIDEPAYWSIEVRGGLIRRLSAFTNREQALEAVGLTE